MLPAGLSRERRGEVNALSRFQQQRKEEAPPKRMHSSPANLGATAVHAGLGWLLGRGGRWEGWAKRSSRTHSLTLSRQTRLAALTGFFVPSQPKI
jgi:hypothetical protein